MLNPSVWDPLAMQQSMETEESMTGGQKKALSFDEVRSYLRNRTENATNPVVGALTLNDMREGFPKKMIRIGITSMWNERPSLENQRLSLTPA